MAHYTSPANSAPAKGFFEFDSSSRASTKPNRHDARIRMLEIYGKDALSWIIDDISLKKNSRGVCTEQFEIDFREQKPARKRPKPKKYL
ncbi:MAG: hypothetical protein FWD72_03480 [Eggerthellaceae bacterium]|nr:hypothetical protein [Eggerthellaceae bacterium]